MFNGLNFSVYLSEAAAQLPLLESTLPRDSFVFTSFHIGEEVDDGYVVRTQELCRRLNAGGYRIVADVSKRTLSTFGLDNLEQFSQRMGIELLRIDYGFTDDELVDLASRRSIVVNCSTLGNEAAARLGQAGCQVYGLHNFYPRPETGLDRELFRRMNARMLGAGIEPMAFIPGDTMLRGPLQEGLPTLEEHRGLPPYAAYLDLSVVYGISGIFVGDGLVTPAQYRLIDEYQQTGVIPIPVCLDREYAHLYGAVFTVRVDSPAPIARFAESREYATALPGVDIPPSQNGPRCAGAVTIDNRSYGRYQGELQLVRQDLPPDNRVNIIGALLPQYRTLLPILPNGSRLRLAEFQ